MLVLKDIKKEYRVGDTAVPALKGVSVAFRANEFVSILGPSGCGKTTLLNIIGGLDRYTTGDLMINGRSTKSFRDADWDAYRNHSIGFVFQTYNLIPHQTVLTNVELALTISGVSKQERRRRAVEALEKVGLGDQLDKKPNQMSGGQMQRVAIARAIVNDPEILLADEPTGALDSATSLQIMEILREIASDRLVIMVTHNPDLANDYSTRILRLKDGVLQDDSNPYDLETAATPISRPTKKKKALSMKTALSLSLHNLLTKKARTFLTSFAGSIGIIGIALILSLSSGINAYIMEVQEDALSSYPITLEQETQDYGAMFSAMVEVRENAERPVQEGVNYVDDTMVNMLSAMMSTTKNDLVSFKSYLEEHIDELKDALNEVHYTYNYQMQIYSEDGKTRINPTTILENMGESFSGMVGMMASSSTRYADTYAANMNIFREMIDNTDLLKSQYDVIAGNWATDAHEVMLVLNEHNTVSNMALYALGLEDQSELASLMKTIFSGQKPDLDYKDYTYDDFVGMTFRIVPNDLFYVRSGETYEVDGISYPVWKDLRKDADFDQEAFAKEHGITVKISGLVRPNPDAVSTSLRSGTIAYNSSLSKELMDMVRVSDIAIQQTEQTPGVDVLSGLPFDDGTYDALTDEEKIAFFSAWIAGRQREKADLMLAILASVGVEEQVSMELASMTAEERAAYAAEHFLDLADADPETFKALILSLMGDQYKEYAAQLEAMDAEALAEMMLSFKEMDPSGPAPETPGMAEMIQGINQFFEQANAEQIDELVIALLTLHKSSGNMDDLLAEYTTAELAEMFDNAFASMTDEEKIKLYSANLKKMLSDTVYERRLIDLGFVDPDSPASISLYAKDFASKDKITAFIAAYNESVGEEGEITYTDMVGLMLSSITTIIDAISYVLIAFVSISLVVSSIMIGIITYISVLERTKEIGILRAIGASRRDISRVFNAETLIVGFCAGAIGILATILLCIPINIIIHIVSGISAINAALPIVGGIVLVLISMLLTLVAGLVPSRLAAKKDPVLALRTE